MATAEFEFDAALGREATLAALKALAENARRPDFCCTALRIYNCDGTWEDIVLGGTESERAQALAELHQRLNG